MKHNGSVSQNVFQYNQREFSLALCYFVHKHISPTLKKIGILRHQVCLKAFKIQNLWQSLFWSVIVFTRTLIPKNHWILPKHFVILTLLLLLLYLSFPLLQAHPLVRSACIDKNHSDLSVSLHLACLQCKNSWMEKF